MFEGRFMVEMMRNGDSEAFSSDYIVPRSSYLDLHLNDLGLGESPSSRASLPFEFSPSSSFSNGFCSSDDGFPPFSTKTPTTPFVNGQGPFNKNMNDGLVDDLDLCGNLFRMSISDEERGKVQMSHYQMDPNSFRSRNVDGFWALKNGDSGYDGFRYIPHGVALSNDDDESHPKGFAALTQNLSDDLSWYMNQRDYLLEPRKGDGRSWPRSVIGLNKEFSNISPYSNDASVYSQQSVQSNVAFDVNNVSNGSRMPDDISVPQSFLSWEAPGKIGTSACEDGLIIQGTGLKLAVNDSHNLSKGRKCSIDVGKVRKIFGSVYLMAKDQNGCRFLQKIFDEGSVPDATVIFNEVIDHVTDLMMDPFGNYFVQKLLDVCTEDQRMQIVVSMISGPGQLVKICLNPYGTRVVQKLIETLGTRQQVLLMKSALKPGILYLVRDLNGNHVIKRCLQCLSTEDNKFIFDAALKFCVEIATHRHGCCVLQRCISHSIGPQRDKLIAEIFRNGLLLAQDPFGNYVVQYVLELKGTSVAANKLLSQFKGHYIDLSTQKFSSHVIEKCLKHYPESRSQIILEFVSAHCFERLLQDPFANYVIQSALAVTKGPLRACLVEAVRARASLRTNPYCKRIFSRRLLKN